MPNETPLPFAVRPEAAAKDAAKALQKLSYLYRWENDRAVKSIGFVATDDHCSTDARSRDCSEGEFYSNLARLHNKYHVMMVFIVVNPAASYVLPENLSPGADRDWLANTIKNWRESDRPSIADRAWVSSEHALSQARMQTAIVARGASQRTWAR